MLNRYIQLFMVTFASAELHRGALTSESLGSPKGNSCPSAKQKWVCPKVHCK